MNTLVWAANLLGWPAIHLSISRAFLHLPACWFEHDNWLTSSRRWERSGRLYRNHLSVRSWKALLPDGAPLLGGFAKKQLRSRDLIYLRRFLLETRRAELAHWCMLCCLPLFFLWNPVWACGVMTLYALSANMPCIVAQRYNRMILARLIETKNRVQAQP